MVKPMSLQAHQEMLNSMRERYQSGTWTVKNKLLNALIEVTDYDRKYAIKRLNQKRENKSNSARRKRGKAPIYDEDVIKVLELAWHASNQICSKRIVPFLPELIASLERHNHIRITAEVRTKLLSISPATFDRLLKKERTKVKGSVTTTKPGSLLKSQIKVRTFSDWNEQTPGFFEIDLVAHCGETVTGIFINTLVMTDIVTTWTECIPLIRKSADDVILGLNTAKELLPYKILGLDVDNGTEFINYDIMDYCEVNQITFTRSRPYKKNDQAHVEERNGSIVRRLICYDRYETEEAWKAMSNLYAVLRLYINFFQPSLKLKEKIRNGSKMTKRYETAKTPYQRVMTSDHISTTVKQALTKQYEQLDPVLLKNRIQDLQNRLWSHIWTGEISLASDELASNSDELDTKIINGNPVSTEPKKYRRIKKTRRKRDWKTRKDAFEYVMDFIKLEI